MSNKENGGKDSALRPFAIRQLPPSLFQRFLPFFRQGLAGAPRVELESIAYRRHSPLSSALFLTWCLVAASSTYV